MYIQRTGEIAYTEGHSPHITKQRVQNHKDARAKNKKILQLKGINYQKRLKCEWCFRYYETAIYYFRHSNHCHAQKYFIGLLDPWPKDLEIELYGNYNYSTSAPKMIGSTTLEEFQQPQRSVAPSVDPSAMHLHIGTSINPTAMTQKQIDESYQNQQKSIINQTIIEEGHALNTPEGRRKQAAIHAKAKRIRDKQESDAPQYADSIDGMVKIFNETIIKFDHIPQMRQYVKKCISESLVFFLPKLF